MKTPMSTAGRTDASGFTLVELMVVLFLMALFASLVFGLNARQRDSLALRDFGVSLVAYLQLARSTALTEGRPAQCLLNRETGRISCTLLPRTLSLPRGMQLAVDGITDQSRNLLLMEYFMDGSALGGVLTLRYRDDAVRVEVDPLLGVTTFRFEESPDADIS